MSHNDWQTIWQTRHLSDEEPVTLESLLALDGFDTLGSMMPSAWREYVASIILNVNLTSAESVFEIGCGAGAFLLPMYEQGFEVAGCDYAENLVAIAAQAMPNANFSVCDAIEVNTAEQYDLVVANSVFFYFPDYAYAENVLNKLLRKARKAVAILDVPDRSKQAEALKLRKGTLGQEEYEQRYQGLPHLYYDWAWFQQVLHQNDVQFSIEKQHIRGYLHNLYRFNVFAHRRRI